MKKAKIVLSAVALFAVVGGALAFKANRLPKTFYTGVEGQVCTAPTTLPYTTINNGSPTRITTLPHTTLSGGVCAVKTLYFDN